MSHPLHAEDPEPAERVPAGPLFVPVRPGPAGCTARLFRTPLGGRTAVGFTSPQRLAAALGGGQPWVRLSEPALRALAEPVGATTVTVDPRCAPAPDAPARRPLPDTAREAGAAANGAREARPVTAARDALPLTAARTAPEAPRLPHVLRAPRVPHTPRRTHLRAV
ncbi:hypothetical protein ADL22_15055 [Streptomyces sp. NRRL F-4489]|nr:SAV_915 family protein [Streptomyces sp. NRRL F-4489]KUL40398.1 hypothetical protein ADL22_15055 [Streptomyces sp. NRRL F-4489]